MMEKAKKQAIWDTDGLAPPCENIDRDLSCQGSIAVALQCALSEIVDEDQQITTNNSVDGVDDSNSDGSNCNDNNNCINTTSTKEASDVSDRKKQKIKYDDDDSNDTDTESSIDAADCKSKNSKPAAASTTTTLNQDGADWIMKSFGQAMIESRHRQHVLLKKCCHDRKTPSVQQNEEGELLAPTAVLRGRLDHSNRLGTKWRMEIHDVRIAARQHLSTTRQKRRKHQRSTGATANNAFWDMAAAPTHSSSSNTAAANIDNVSGNNDNAKSNSHGNVKSTSEAYIKIQRLELLAFNDLG